MKKINIFYFLALCCSLASAQKINNQQAIKFDSLTQYYANHKANMELAYSFKTIADIYHTDNNIQQAINYYNQSLNIYQAINDKGGIANSYFNIGKIYNSQGNRKKALQYRDKSTNIKTEIAREQETANSLNKLAYNYNKFNTKLALNYYYQSLKLYYEINDKTGIVNSINNIGTLYIKQGEKNKGADCYKLSLKIKEETKKRALAIKTEMNNPDRIAYSFANIATIYFAQKNYFLAHAYADSSIIISKELHYPNSTCKAESLLTQIDSIMAFADIISVAKKQKHIADSRTHYKKYLTLHDSLQNANGTINQPTTPNQSPGKTTPIKTTTNPSKATLLIFSIILLLVLVYLYIKKLKK